jgi:hypothetical protein
MSTPTTTITGPRCSSATEATMPGSTAGFWKSRATDSAHNAGAWFTDSALILSTAMSTGKIWSSIHEQSRVLCGSQSNLASRTIPEPCGNARAHEREPSAWVPVHPYRPQQADDERTDPGPTQRASPRVSTRTARPKPTTHGGWWAIAAKYADRTPLRRATSD